MIQYLLIPLTISISVMVLLIAITITCRVKFDKSQTRNKLTVLPYYLVSVYLFGKILEHSIIMTRGDGH